jgi:heterodisulfide reductase subunit A-like polyferredoxin/coenzyme F420-reducing hydrogenase delta subunit
MNVYEALAHPLREKILRILDAERLLPYKDLMNRLDLKKTGLFNYHLKKLEGFIEKREGLYQLTSTGQNAIRLLLATEQLMAGESLDLHEMDIRGMIYRIGVIICTCGEETRQALNIGEIVEKVNELPYVERTRVFPHLCMLENVDQLKDWCERHFLNNLVVAACSPRIHREFFSTIREQLKIPVEFANIREHCAWVHAKTPKRATEKAILLIRAATVMLRNRKPTIRKELPIRKSVAIIGGGLAGLTAAKVLAKSNHSLVLIEKEPCLGGVARRWERIHGAMDCGPCMIAEDVSSIILSANTQVLTNTELIDISGTIGNYEILATQHPRYIDFSKCISCEACADVCPELRPDEHEYGFAKRTLIHVPCPAAFPNKPVIKTSDIEFCRSCRKCEQACPSGAINLNEGPKTRKFTVGAIILAIGAQVSNPLTIRPLDSIQYNPIKDIITSYEFERILAPDGPTRGEIIKLSNGKPARSITVLQCLNSKEMCSSYCCNVAQKYLDIITQSYPEITMNIVYRKDYIPSDRTTFIPENEHIHFCSDLSLTHLGPKRVLKTDVGSFPADIIVLNMGMEPGEEQIALRSMTNFSLDSRGFINPRSLSSGIWACGAVTGPKTYNELVTDARNAALEALLLLSKDSLTTGEMEIHVNQDKCGFCGLCIELCPFKAITISGESLRIDPLKCQACGACIAVCPTGALEAAAIQDEIKAAINALSLGTSSPRILVFCCESCGYPAADSAGIQRLEYDPGALILRLPCTGCIDAEFVISALNQGFDGVMVVGCHETACRFFEGIQKAKKRLEALGDFFGDELKQRIRVLTVSAVEGHVLADQMNQFATELKEIQ